MRFDVDAKSVPQASGATEHRLGRRKSHLRLVACSCRRVDFRSAFLLTEAAIQRWSVRECRLAVAAGHLCVCAPEASLAIIVPQPAEGSCQDERLPRLMELPPKDRTCSGLRLRADELARRLIS
ncbi:hypothetical protein GOC88_29170, partial [Sinorhizobium medicae]|nr:hypothetical protein [Sinorhizobium medicae]